MNQVIRLNETLIAEQIFTIRGEKVLLDYHLAELYEVDVKQLKRSVNRNLERFPGDFMFQLTRKELEPFYKKSGRGEFSKFLPYAFTEQGVAMLSGILRSERAVQVNIAIMRAFVQMRSFIETNKDLIKKVAELEATMDMRLNENDEKISKVFEAIRLLIKENSKPKQPIGFHLPNTN